MTEEAFPADSHGSKAACSQPAPAPVPAKNKLARAPPKKNGVLPSLAKDVRVYEGLPPHGLSDDQLRQLFLAIEAAKKSSRNLDSMVCGWRLVYARRPTGGSARGDFMVVDPRDGQKIYSIQGLKRKLGISDDEQLSAWQQEMDARAGQKRPREDQAESSEGEQPSLMVNEREPRRTRAPVNYFDTSAAHGQRRVMTETVLSELESAEASRSRRREGCVGLDFYSIVQSVHIRHDGKEDEPLPWPSTRQALSSLLRSGKVRRRLALPLELQGSTANALHQLVMSTLQVESDHDAPWTLQASAAVDENKPRLHVWKGLTPPHLPGIRGEQLVGRRIEIWWDGDCCFHCAIVEAYNERAKQYGEDCEMGSHVVCYDNGLRVVESLEGVGQPHHWRLLSEDTKADTAPKGCGYGGANPCKGQKGASRADAANAADTVAVSVEKSGEIVMAQVPNPKIEVMTNLSTVVSSLPLARRPVSEFHGPPGWCLQRSRHLALKKNVWVRENEEAGSEEFGSREELEDFIEVEAKEQGRVWLGQLVEGEWEIQHKSALPALQHVVDGLVAFGVVRCIEPRHSGRAQLTYLVSNRYFKGEPFPRPKTQPVRVVPEEDELCDLELERLRNIERNKELLRQLGLT